MAEERKDYLLAFAIGAVVGVGATMLLAGGHKKKRLIYRMKNPAARRLRRGARRLRRSIRDRS